MKKNLSIRSLRGLVIGAVAAALLTNGVIAQPNGNKNSAEDNYMERLEKHMVIAQQNMKYEAPVENEWMASDDLVQTMDLMAAITENTLKYKAPVTETENELIDIPEYGKNQANPVKAISHKTTGNAQFITAGYHPAASEKHYKKAKCRRVSGQMAQKN
jgi:hypothetical protein